MLVHQYVSISRERDHQWDEVLAGLTSLARNTFYARLEDKSDTLISDSGTQFKDSQLLVRLKFRENFVLILMTRPMEPEALTHFLETLNERLSEIVEIGENRPANTESHGMLDAIIQNIPNMIFVKDAENLRFLRLNKAGEQLIGIKNEEIVGKTDYDFFSKEQADFFTEKDREVLQQGKISRICEEPISTKDGVKYLQTTKVPVLDEAGRPKFLLGISEDITEAKRLETHRLELLRVQASKDEAEKMSIRLKYLALASEALNESLDLRTMLGAFAQVCTSEMFQICIIDLTDCFQNQIDRTVSFAAKDEVLHTETKLDDFNKGLVAPEGIKDAISQSQSKFHLGKTTQEMISLVGGDLFRTEIEKLEMGTILIAPLKYHGTTFGSLTLIASQSSQDMNALDLSYAEDLARRASLAIQNARLFQQANAANRAKSSFLTTISHEVRTPLGAILGFAELMLEDREIKETQRQHVSTIVKNGHQLLQIVDEILDLSKVESDKLKIEKIEFSLMKLLEDIEALFRIKVEGKGLNFHFWIQKGIPSHYISDPLRLRQILVNLIGNAIKFTKFGGIEIRVLYVPSKSDKNVGQLVFKVIDTGVGLSQEQAAKLFQPFEQADESTSRIFGGTGLGLYLSRKLAHLLDGEVELEKSAPGEGSRFSLSVNLQSCYETQIKYEEHESVDSLADIDHLSYGRHVLVVDDSEDNQTLIKNYLRTNQLEVDLAQNGVQAVERALSHSYDMVLMDIQMPEMDGFEAVKTLRKNGYKGVVVALTAHAMKGDREKCLSEGFDDYICKPVSRKTLAQCLSRNFHH